MPIDKVPEEKEWLGVKTPKLGEGCCSPKEEKYIVVYFKDGEKIVEEFDNSKDAVDRFFEVDELYPAIAGKKGVLDPNKITCKTLLCPKR